MIQTKNLILVPTTREEARAQIEAMSPDDRKHLSADWLALLHGLEWDDPWVLGFTITDRGLGESVGSCGFKGPPVDGWVEIAYGVNPEHEGNGHATEAAAALARFAFADERVRFVRAHTLPEENASGRVLTKCGFRRVGEVIDLEDGLVWRWELKRQEGVVE